jgi:hypothetical protein
MGIRCRRRDWSIGFAAFLMFVVKTPRSSPSKFRRRPSCSSRKRIEFSTSTARAVASLAASDTLPGPGDLRTSLPPAAPQALSLMVYAIAARPSRSAMSVSLQAVSVGYWACA